MFKEIYDRAHKSVIYNDSKKLEKEQSLLKKSKENDADLILKWATGYVNQDYRKDNCSAELLFLIDKYGFGIKSYERNINEEYSCYDQLLETYCCEYNNWRFLVENFSDVDFDGGVFLIKDIINLKTGEKVAFYCDLSSRTTSENRLMKFLRFLNFESEMEFSKEEYKEYHNLIKLIKNYDAKSIEMANKLTLGAPFAEISINSVVLEYDIKTAIINMSCDEDENMVVEILIDEEECIRNEILNSELRHTRYMFDYKSMEDFEELIKCIESFFSHVNGYIGYVEDGQLYTNEDLENLFNTTRNKFVYISNGDCYLGRLNNLNKIAYGYGNEGTRTLNKYNGLEIAVDYELKFDLRNNIDDSLETNLSVISVTYDKSIDDSNCILEVKNYVYKDDDNYLVDEYKENYYELSLNKDFMVDSITYKGSFTQVYGKLKEYLYVMSNIYGIPV